MTFNDLVIITEHVAIRVSAGDYVVLDTNSGYYYPYSNEKFNSLYEPFLDVRPTAPNESSETVVLTKSQLSYIEEHIEKLESLLYHVNRMCNHSGDVNSLSIGYNLGAHVYVMSESLDTLSQIVEDVTASADTN